MVVVVVVVVVAGVSYQSTNINFGLNNSTFSEHTPFQNTHSQKYFSIDLVVVAVSHMRLLAELVVCQDS